MENPAGSDRGMDTAQFSSGAAGRALLVAQEGGREGFFSCTGTGDVSQHRSDTLTAGFAQCCLTPGIQQSQRNLRMTGSFWLEKAFQIMPSAFSPKGSTAVRDAQAVIIFVSCLRWVDWVWVAQSTEWMEPRHDDRRVLPIPRVQLTRQEIEN